MQTPDPGIKLQHKSQYASSRPKTRQAGEMEERGEAE